jgi:repressor LexA
MLDAGILPGDLVIVRKQANAESGQIVVALVEDEATVKTLRKRRNRIELHPANPHYPILLPDPHEVSILGKVIEVRRTLDA